MKFLKCSPFPLTCLTTRRAKTIHFPEKAAGSSGIIILFFLLQTIVFCSSAQPVQGDGSILDIPVTIKVEQKTIGEVLSQLSASDPRIRFSYINNEIPLQEKVSFDFTAKPLRQVLDVMLKNRKVTYIGLSRQVVLKKEVKNSGTDDPAGKSDTTKGLWRIFSLPGKTAVSLKQRLSFSMFIMPANTYRVLKSDNIIYTLNRNNDEKSKFGVQAGGYMTYLRPDGISLRGGISYINMGEQGSHTDTVDLQGNPDTPVYFTYVNNYHYLTFPLMAGYTLDKKSWYLSAHAGFEAGILLGYKSTFPDNADDLYSLPVAEPPGKGHGKGKAKGHNKKDKVSSRQEDPGIHGYKGIPLIFPFMIECGYHLGKDVSVFLSPSLVYFVSSIYTSDDLMKQRPYALGLKIGLTYRPFSK